MKTRQGFVSNSSSTSFIIGASEVDEVRKKYGVKCYKVKDIIKAFDTAREAYVEKMPDFIYEEVAWAIRGHYYNDLIILEKDQPDCYITESYDRDWAFEDGLSRYPKFEEDL